MSWAIWGEFCRRKHDASVLLQPINVHWVSSFLRGFNDARSANIVQNFVASVGMDDRWEKPPLGQFRLDIDAGFNERDGCFDIDVVIRDDLGELVAAKTCPIHNPGSVFRGELWALLLGMELSKMCGLSNVCVYSDSIEAINVVRDEKGCLGTDGNIVKSIKELLMDGSFLRLLHMKRKTNDVTHKIAKFALSCLRSYTWIFSGFPAWICNITLNDL
ncbi:uncharacterized protein [Henckelia pumila]|uniref:uncharacterized protein n=1 Tax=Henckelia pumila TaxID=405737 RepID=UPI003C6E16F8